MGLSLVLPEILRFSRHFENKPVPRDEKNREVVVEFVSKNFGSPTFLVIFFCCDFT